MYPIENVGFDAWLLEEQDTKHIFNRFRNCFGNHIDILIVDNKLNVYMDEKVKLDKKEKQALKETGDVLLQESIDIAKYKYPIEKYGWEYSGTNNELKTEVFKRSVCVMNIYKDGSIHISNSNLKFNIFEFEELQAIYETAKQIKENRLNDKSY